MINESTNIWKKFRTLIISTCILIIYLLILFPVEINPVLVIAMALLISIFGIPHGALDYKLLEAVWSKKSLPLIVFLYAILGIGTVLIWVSNPTFMLAIFLIMSSYHFGGDYPLGLTARFLAGFLLLGLPVFFYPTEVHRIFTIITNNNSSESVIWGLQVINFISIAYFSCLLLLRKIHGEQIIEFILLGFLAWVSTPLIYFTIYFCLFHSVKHFSEMGNILGQESLAKLFLLATPISLITFSIGLISFFYLHQSFDTTQNDAIIKVVFIGLSALTTPHMLLVEHIRLKNDNNATSSSSENEFRKNV